MTEAENPSTTTKTDSLPKPSRRSLFTGATAAAALASLPAMASPDAELIALCAEYRTRRALIWSMDNPAPGQEWTDAECETAGRAMYQAVEDIAEIAATTAAGLRAKAGALKTALEYDVPVRKDETVEDCADRHEWLAYQLALDVLAGAGA